MTAFPRLVLGVCWVAGTVASLAAQGDQKRLVELRDAKLAAPFLAKGAWSTDYDAVRVKAAKSGKPILIYFTRSYAPCPSCAILEQGLLAEPAFLGATSSVERFCHVTSLVAQDRFQRLLTDLGGRSFPYFAVVDAEGKPIARFDEQPTLANFKKLLAGEVAEYVALRDRAAKGDKAAKAEFLIRRITLGHLTPAEIEVALRKADYLDAAQRARIRGGLVNLEIAAIFGQIDESNPKSYGTAVSRLLAMKRGNRIPTGQMAASFWQVLLAHADTSGSPELFAEALAAIEKMGVPAARQGWLKSMKQRLVGIEADIAAAEILRRIDASDAESRSVAVNKLLAMKRAGRIPTDRMAVRFWEVLLNHAENTEDPALFAEAIAAIEKSGVPAAKTEWLERMKLRLKALEFMKSRKAAEARRKK